MSDDEEKIEEKEPDTTEIDEACRGKNPFIIESLMCVQNSLENLSGRESESDSDQANVWFQASTATGWIHHGGVEYSGRTEKGVAIHA